MITIRPARFPEDTAAIDAIDTLLTTDTVFTVTATGSEFLLRATEIEPALAKDVGIEGLDEPEWDSAAVALDGDTVCGFLAAEYHSWNRRVLISHINVSSSHRGRGVGRALVDSALAYGRERGARTAWLEVSNVNFPAVSAYQRMGFRLCGLDTSLYVGTPDEGEIALFMSRPVD